MAIRELLFLKTTGVLIGELTSETDRSGLNLENFYIKEVDIDETKGEVWIGDYHTGYVHSSVEKPVVSEEIVKYATNNKILDVYPLHKQINIIIETLAANESMIKPESFTEMMTFLNAQREKHKLKCESYAANIDSFVWISEDAIKEELAKKRQDL